ncbi:MAG: undecaprenyl-phosphate glucose phosphotransferase [Calditrichaeota bacterium]|nr:undecaprenyl-phosphate glucose phosphotransferase [Calditrichota bacterium]MCB0268022.1 undecaprenyl-phosphate glucose phosphotransferase [Calditrichota bacterium]
MNQNIYRRNLSVPFLKMVTDAISLTGAVLFSYYLRFFSPLTELIPVTKGLPSLTGYVYFSIFLVIAYLLLFGATNAYRSRFFSTFSQDIPSILKNCFLGILIAMSGAFLYRDFSYSRLVFGLIFVNSIVFLLVGRFIFHRIKQRFLSKGFSKMNVVLAGSAGILRQVYERLHIDTTLNFNLTGYFANAHVNEIAVPHLGKLSDLPGLIASENAPDGVVIAFEQGDHQNIWQILQATEGRNLELFYVPDVLDIITSKFHTLEAGGIPLLQLKAYVLAGWQGLLKRGFDVIVSLTGLMLLSPFFLLLATIIKLTSPGPVFYRQKRVSLDGQEFAMIKFRSMRSDAEADTGPVWAKADDPRTTSIGKLLRRTSLDELPQLINVIKGEMSLVGPRPERRHFVEQFQSHVPKYLERHRVRCGMTGWAQVNGLRGQSSIEDRTRYDLYYIENWSLWFDIKIILMTVSEIIRGENAY